MKHPTPVAQHSDGSELYDTVMLNGQSISMRSYVPEALQLLASMSGSFSGSWSPRATSPDRGALSFQPHSQQPTEQGSCEDGPLDGRQDTASTGLSTWLCIPALSDVSESVLPACACRSSTIGAPSIQFPSCDATTALHTPVPETPLSISSSQSSTDSDEELNDLSAERISPPTPTLSAFPIATNSHNGKRIQFDEAFSEGKLLPFMVDYCVSGSDHPDVPDDDVSAPLQWNGYLPLDPVPQLHPPSRCRFLNRRRRHGDDISRTGIVSAFDTLHPVCLRTLCFLYMPCCHRRLGRLYV